jgi:hypothetical protein
VTGVQTCALPILGFDGRLILKRIVKEQDGNSKNESV